MDDCEKKQKVLYFSEKLYDIGSVLSGDSGAHTTNVGSGSPSPTNHGSTGPMAHGGSPSTNAVTADIPTPLPVSLSSATTPQDSDVTDVTPVTPAPVPAFPVATAFNGSSSQSQITRAPPTAEIQRSDLHAVLPSTDIDLAKEKRRQYHRDYYLRRKENDKMRKCNPGDVSQPSMGVLIERRDEYDKDYNAAKRKKGQQPMSQHGSSQMNTQPLQRVPLGDLTNRVKNPSSYYRTIMNQMIFTSNQPSTQCNSAFLNKENIHPSNQQLSQEPGNQHPPHSLYEGVQMRRTSTNIPLTQRSVTHILSTTTQTQPNNVRTHTDIYTLDGSVNNHEYVTSNFQPGSSQLASAVTNPRFQSIPCENRNLLPLFDSVVNQASPIFPGSSTFIGESSTGRSSQIGIQCENRNLLPLFESEATQFSPVIVRLSTFIGESSTGRNSQIGIQCENRNLLPSYVSEANQFSPVIGRSSTYSPVIGESSTGRSTQANINPSTVSGDLLDDPYDFVYRGFRRDHRVLKKQPTCRYCGATKFEFEFPTFCCMSGKTTLAVTNVPPELYNLFTDQSQVGKTFRHHIRAYNTNFSFTSMGVKLDKNLANSTTGVYTFRVNGGIYHQVDQLVPRDGQPRYLQLYFYDPESEFNQRAQWSNVDKNILRILTRAFAANPYATTLRSMAQLGPLDNYRVTLNATVELDQRVYNRPTTSEVAGIWVEGNDNITSYKRSIVVYGRSQHCQRIEHYFGCYDPLSYPLFFPNGESGWHSKVPRNGFSVDDVSTDEENIGYDDDSEGSNTNGGRKTVTMREYYCYKFQIRPTENVLLLGGRLLQQFAVDIYIKIETARLQFLEHNQARIRADLYQGIVDCVNAGEVQPSRIGKRVVLPATFIGGPRDMRRRFLDAMALVQDAGKPDIFLTFTCNPSWDEITEELLPGQSAQDRPELVARVFRAKLEDLKKQLLEKHVLGEIEAYIYVIEFQKRGLPHAHFLLIMKSTHKITTPDQYDKLVCAEIPNPTRYPIMHERVVSHMIHGPCGRLNNNSPCMQGQPKDCRFHYPRQFNEHTVQGDDSYPLYRRRDNGTTVKKGKHDIDNRWIVPYNPKLLMMYNCHMNVEICSSIKSVKYVFKYVYKGHDKQSVHIDPDQEEVVNEIKRYQDARYVSPPEAMWRIFGFPLSKINPPVMALQLHLPDKQYVRFRDNDILTSILQREQDKRTMLTAFFELNKVYAPARQYLYKDIPKHFTWNARSNMWKPRGGNHKMRGRVVSANPAEGERYYLRVLLSHVKGPQSFDDLYTANGEKHQTFRKSALERGLIENDDCLSQCLTEASVFQFPHSLRRLFATILIFCEPGDVRRLWDEHYDSLSEDYRRHCQNSDHVLNLVLKDILVFLQSMGKSLHDFDLPHMTTNHLESGSCRELQEETSILVQDDHLSARDSLNPDQKFAYDTIIRYVDDNRPGVFFIDGPGGTGKTFLYNALLAQIRSRGEIALATASSGAAANNMPGGRTAHSRFKIPLIINNNSLCNISKQSGTAQLLRRARLIIWDEASMAKRQAIEALDRTMQDIIGVRQPFGGKIMVLGGDFRQVLPVIKKGTRAQIVDSSLRMSPLWSVIKKIRLTVNMRARTDPWFSDFLLRVGDGEEEVIDGTFVRIPDEMTIPYNKGDKSKDDLISAIFPSIEANSNSPDYIISRAILSTKNENVDEINDELIGKLCGEERIYYSFDEAEDDPNNYYPVDFLNSLNVSGLPPHCLRLKVGCPVILIRNIDPSNGLCNGTRLICKGFQRNVIDAEIAVGQHAGKRVFLPRIPLCPSDNDMFPFKLKRKQFPIRLSFAMTINKAQGQTIPNVGVYLPDSVFSHGQLYVALSRGISREKVKVLVKPTQEFRRPGVYTSNVVYREVLHDADA